MIDHAQLASLAAHLGLRIVRPLSGGEFGAVLVVDASGNERVFKALPSPAWERIFARGAALANVLHAAGYPAPQYIGTGAALGSTWSLQAVLPGTVPEVASEPHMRQLLALAERHAGAAPERRSDGWLRGQSPYLDESLARVVDDARTHALGTELRATLERHANIKLLDDGIVHSDFHNRNFLAEGDRVTGVFDWEFAGVGDWRYDLVTLAFWSALLPAQVSREAAAMAIAFMHEHCPPDVLALFTAVRTVNQLEFDLRMHPEFVVAISEGIEREIAPWWRNAG